MTAPAGHGKTEVIAASVAAHPELRFLVLTHTNAGVAAIRRRLSRFGVTSNARVETLSSLALRLVRAFPTGIGWAEDPKSINHKKALVSAQVVLGRPTVLTAFSSSYDRIIIDEYQDCTGRQHNLVCRLASTTTTVVLGDPLQAIFNIDRSDPLVNWDEVTGRFPVRGHLHTPHRWSSTTPALGRWLRDIRDPLELGLIPVRLDSDVVTIYNLERPPSQGSLVSLIAPGESTVIIAGNSATPMTISNIAKAHASRGVYEHETVDQHAALKVADQLTSATSDARRVLDLLEFLKNAATGIGKIQGCSSILKNLEADGSVGRSKAPLAHAVTEFLASPTPMNLDSVLCVCRFDSDVYAYKRTQLSLLSRGLKQSGADWQLLPETLRSLIDQTSHSKRPQENVREVGSTLRVKGLEYDHVILVDPKSIPSVQHLYVALSRATRRITIALGPGETLGRLIS
ncbi:UvrD-helicase domain-containing protein [Flaviflexus sp. JY899]|uniref:UvrD-helicase domain-containing protein n=2 Tax=Flaviflexus equikiangi TaxID=2758573 RepID=A0ABS2TEX8_9ACTO|nr:UvrD-helicase domain-containing protein [Flaviflexus equikiangi]